MNSPATKTILVFLVLAALSIATLSALRQLPANSDEAKVQVEAIQGLIGGLQTSLPPSDSIGVAETRLSRWISQTPTRGSVPVSVEDLKNTLKEIEKEQQALGTARVAWSAAQAEAKVRGTKLEKVLSDRVWPDQLRGALRASRDLILLLGWPAALVLALAFALYSDRARTALASFTNIFKKVALPGGLELTMWREEFRKSQSDTLKAFRADVQAEYDKLAERYTIKDTLGRILKSTFEPELQKIRNGNLVDYRATIHVRDALLKNSYYQLVDYLPSGGNRGRAWSVRFGMVGKAWRLEEDNWNGEVPKTSRDLIQNWGLTRDEAEAPGRQTMLCCILKATTGIPLAAMYIDSKGQDEFGTATQMQGLAKALQKAAADSGLIASLDAIWDEIKRKAPLVEIYGNGN